MANTEKILVAFVVIQCHLSDTEVQCLPKRGIHIKRLHTLSTGLHNIYDI